MENLTQKFLKELGNIKDPVIFLGLCPILKIQIYKEEKDENGKEIPRDFHEVLKDLMSSYDRAGRKRKRELLKILRDANKAQGGEADGSGTKNTEISVQDKEVQ